LAVHSRPEGGSTISGYSLGGSQPFQPFVPSAHDAGVTPSQPKRAGMRPMIVQPMWPAASAATKFCGGPPETCAMSSASRNERACSIGRRRMLTASGACAVQRIARQRPRWSRSSTGPQIVVRNGTISSGAPFTWIRSSRRPNSFHPSGVR